MDGGAGSDIVDYGSEGGANGVVVNLLGDGGSQGGLPSDTAIDSFGFTDHVTRIPNVIGTQFADEIHGGNHDNILSGGGGDDLLQGGQLNDTLDGGTGTDRAVYSGDLSDYEIVQNPNGSLTIVDLRGGSPDGTDTVTDVELFEFADGERTLGELLPNAEPTITSDGGGDTAAASVAENSTAVTTVTATDPDAGATQTYSIVGGADAALFAIDATTGALSFVAAPDFEAPTDAGGDNVYDVTVQASDGTLTDSQAIAVSDTNVGGPTNGGPGDDLLVGTEEEDSISGFGGNDTIQGLAGNDFLDGGTGDDIIEGGGGFDTLVVSGASTDYTFSSNGDGTYTVTDLRPGGDGVDVVSDIDKVLFSNGPSVSTCSPTVSAFSAPTQTTTPSTGLPTTTTFTALQEMT